MRVTICENKQDLGFQAAKLGIDAIQSAIEKQGKAVVVLSTGLSQSSCMSTWSRHPSLGKRLKCFTLMNNVGLKEKSQGKHQRVSQDSIF